MQTLKEISVKKVLELLPTDLQEQLFDAYVQRLYLPKITRLDNIFGEIQGMNFDIDFDKLLADFCEAFPELVHASEQKTDVIYKRTDRRFYFKNSKGNTRYLAIQEPVSWKENNRLIDFFVQRKLPVWPGVSLWWT